MNSVLIKRIKGAIIKETDKAFCIRAFNCKGEITIVWLPKTTVKSELKGFFTISRKIAIEKALKFEEIIRKPVPLNPLEAKICHEYND